MYTNANPTLQDAFEMWKAAPHPKNPAQTNAERKANDLSNYERALRCFAAGVGEGEHHPGALPLSTLQCTPVLLERYVREGAVILANAKQKAPPKEKTLSNLVSCMKGVQKAACHELPTVKTVRERLRTRPKRTQRPGFPKDAWPPGLKAEWDAWKRWKMTPFLPASESKYRDETSRESSFSSYLRKLNPYVGFLVRELGYKELTLEDLCNLDHYRLFLNWYLDLEADGGYYGGKEVGITLAVQSQYLVAKGRISERGEDGVEIWTSFYKQANDVLKLGAEKGQLKGEKEIGAWKPWHLAELAELIWQSNPVHRSKPHGQRHERQLIARKRTALFFRLAMETPLRMRNWQEMQWGKNLYKGKDGRWVVMFRGDELKVGRRGYETNVYKRTYSAEASAWIERWRQELEQRLGADFETTYRYVFLSSDLKPTMIHYSTLSTQIDGLCEEVWGKPFHPHMVRHIVASHIVNEQGAGGIKLAAELLGDTETVVLKTYYKPNTQEAMVSYLDACHRHMKKS